MAIKIALAGNPNCGKTTLFNVLTGGKRAVGNRPGVTVVSALGGNVIVKVKEARVAISEEMARKIMI